MSINQFKIFIMILLITLTGSQLFSQNKLFNNNFNLGNNFKMVLPSIKFTPKFQIDQRIKYNNNIKNNINVFNKSTNFYTDSKRNNTFNSGSNSQSDFPINIESFLAFKKIIEIYYTIIS